MADVIHYQQRQRSHPTGNYTGRLPVWQSQIKVQRDCRPREQSSPWPLTRTDGTNSLWLAFKTSCTLTSGHLTSAHLLALSLCEARRLFWTIHHPTILLALCNRTFLWVACELFCSSCFYQILQHAKFWYLKGWMLGCNWRQRGVGCTLFNAAAFSALWCCLLSYSPFILPACFLCCVYAFSLRFPHSLWRWMISHLQCL